MMRRSSMRWLGPALAVALSGAASSAPPTSTPLPQSMASPAAPPSGGDSRVRIEALKAERTRLQEELRAALTDDARLIGAPGGGVLIGVPASLIESIVGEAVAGPLRNVRLSLKDVVKIRHSDRITTKTLVGRMTLGEYAITVDVKQVRAVMKPLKATLTFGSNRIGIDLPVLIDAGDVKATVAFKWDGRKLAGMVCGDLDTTKDLRVRIPPVTVRVRGRFDVEAAGDTLRVRPRIAPVEASFQIEPEKDAWEFLDNLIRSRNAVCEAAIRKADVAAKVKELAGRRFSVRIPTDFVRPMTLPAAFRDTFDVRGRRAGLDIRPAGVTVTPTRIWYGANLSLKTESGKKP